MMRRNAELRTTTLSGRDVAYTVSVSPKATKARVRIGPRGIEVLVPRSNPNRATELLSEQSAWVLRELDRVEALGAIRRPATTLEPGTILLGGERVRVSVAKVYSPRRFATVRRDEAGLTVTVSHRGKHFVANAVERWLRGEARRMIADRVAIWSKAMKQSPNRLYIRSQRTKWGNCSNLRNLSFNWRLVMAPQDTVDAIVIHELAHLLEPTHETRFWLLVNSHCPDYKRRTRWLETHQAVLFAPLSAA